MVATSAGPHPLGPGDLTALMAQQRMTGQLAARTSPLLSLPPLGATPTIVSPHPFLPIKL